MYTNTAELIQGLYGVKTRPVENPLVTTIGITPVKFVSNNPGRVSLLFVNHSANIIYVNYHSQVSAGNGWYIAPNGGEFTLNYIEDLQLTCYEFLAVAAAAGSTVYTLENVIYGDKG